MKRNLLVYLTAFFCGMSVMAVELSASRLLAPTFGTSSIIWTVIIGLIMIFLSIGNILGGRYADKYNSMDKLYALIWIASIWIAVIPLVGKYIIDLSVIVLMWILPNNLLVSGSIISCLVIFSLPLIILGMVSPYLVKLGVTDIANNGKTTGEIYALSTIGSILGTFFPTFITIPMIGTSKTFFVFSLILNLLCLYYFITHKARKVYKTFVSSILILILTVIPLSDTYAFWKNNILYEGESSYNYLQVSETKDSVILSTNVAFGVQSMYKKNGALSGYYYDYSLMGPLFSKNMEFKKDFNVLILGLGTGTLAKELKSFYPKVQTEGVEIDEKIVNLSKEYFHLTDDEAKIYINDGRTFLSTKDAKKYDIIVCDAYHDITIPFHMATREFFSEVKKHLNPNGLILVNINMRSEKNNQLNQYLTQTLKSVMKKVYTCEIKNITNTLVVASDDLNILENYKENIKAIDNKQALFKVADYVNNNLKETTQSDLILTDDLAPVEILGQKVLDEVVSKELENFKKQMNGNNKGIKGIFEMLSE